MPKSLFAGHPLREIDDERSLQEVIQASLVRSEGVHRVCPIFEDHVAKVKRTELLDLVDPRFRTLEGFQIFGEQLLRLGALFDHELRWWSANLPVKLEKLVFVDRREDGVPAVEFSHDAPETPHVHLVVVLGAAKQNLRRPVVSRLYVGVDLVSNEA